MNKLILTAAVAATVLTIGAANAADASVKAEANTGIVPTLTNTGSAIKEKAAQAVDATSGAYHETMAEHDASATQADVKAGAVTDAAADAKAAAEHKAKAVDAKAAAKVHSAKAAMHAKKAKVAAGITTDTEAK